VVFGLILVLQKFEKGRVLFNGKETGQEQKREFPEGSGIGGGHRVNLQPRQGKGSAIRGETLVCRGKKGD